jgi:hypothetical protein
MTLTELKYIVAAGARAEGPRYGDSPADAAMTTASGDTTTQS